MQLLCKNCINNISRFSYAFFFNNINKKNHVILTSLKYIWLYTLVIWNFLQQISLHEIFGEILVI
jgi:hypothetical protein